MHVLDHLLSIVRCERVHASHKPNTSKEQTYWSSAFEGCRLFFGKTSFDSRGGGGQQRMSNVSISQEANVICSFSNCLDHCQYIRIQKPGKGSNISPVVFVVFEVVGG